MARAARVGALATLTVRFPPVAPVVLRFVLLATVALFAAFAGMLFLAVTLLAVAFVAVALLAAGIVFTAVFFTAVFLTVALLAVAFFTAVFFAALLLAGALFTAVFFAVPVFFAVTVFFTTPVVLFAMVVLFAAAFFATVLFATARFVVVPAAPAAVFFAPLRATAVFLAVPVADVFPAAVFFAVLAGAVLADPLRGTASVALAPRALVAEEAPVPAAFRAVPAVVLATLGKVRGSATYVLKAVPGRKRATEVFLIFTVSPVRGLRPTRGPLTVFSKEPNPEMATFSPRATVR
ncbi:MAG: hypothetical protein QG608_2612 [Actinomycetota bacterium]|nr:hypothetical protein [Actinomycetota bacterium]